MNDGRIIVFTCNWDAYAGMENAGNQGLTYTPAVIPIRVPCLGRLHPGMILKAFERGAGGVLLLVAWVLATVVRKIAKEGLAATSLDERLEAQAGGRPLSDTLPNVLYWLILLLFLPAILGAFEVRGLLEPVQGMLDKILAMLPNIIGAGVIGLVGWVVARIVRDAFGGDLAAMVRYANERLFDPAGMTSALFEPDAAGSFIGSSFVFMTARDWARFAELFRQDGVWEGRRLLPEGWVRRLLWSESDEIADRVDALRPERRRRALDQRLADAEEAVLDALAARSGRKLARWARELREVADALARAGRR